MAQKAAQPAYNSPHPYYPYADTTTVPLPSGYYRELGTVMIVPVSTYQVSTVYHREIVSGPRLSAPDVTYLKTVCGIAKIIQAVSKSELLVPSERETAETFFLFIATTKTNSRY